MRNKPIQADQLIPTSATPPPEAGFYRVDRNTIGVVGKMSFTDPKTQVMMPVGKGAIPFPGFAPRLFASLVASSTAACTSGVVTVTATAYGITASVFDGVEVYYPGSPSLAAGWYSGFARTSADACTFLAPGTADFASESVNAGSALTSEVTVASIVLPPNTCKVGDIISARLARVGSGVASLHTTNLKVGANSFSRSAVSGAANQHVFNLSGSVQSQTVVRGAQAQDNVMTSQALTAATDITASMTISLTNTLAAAGMFCLISSAKLRIE